MNKPWPSLLPILILFEVVLFVNSNSSLAKSWDEAIRDVKEKAEFYWEYGRLRGAHTWLGTAFNELDIPKHQCAILGRMLGLQSHISHLEENPEPKIKENMSQEKLNDLMYYSRSLSNWALVAEDLDNKTESEKKHIWNLNCVGKMGISENLSFDIDESSARFRIVDKKLYVLGDLNYGFFEHFENVLTEHPEIEYIVLGSGGGNLSDAMKSGLLIRELALSTTLSDNCYSACPLVFIGGIDREIWSPYPKLGFHQIYKGNGRAVGFGEPIYKVVAQYAERMGVDADFLISSMQSASPQNMNEPDMKSLCENRVATWIQRLCSSRD